MAYIGVSPNAGTVATQIITSANGSATSFTLDQTVPDGQSIIVLVGNVVQQPTHQGIAGAYTASGNTITFTGPPANGDNIIIRYLGRSVDTSTSYKKVIRYRYVATNNQTTFTGADSNGLTLSYTADDIDVFLNGVRLDQTDYTATNGTSVVLGSGATTSDELVILAYNTVQLADTVPASTGGTFTGAVTLNGGVSGDVAFDTSTLKIDSSNNRVGVGLTDPSDLFEVSNSADTPTRAIVTAEDSSGSNQNAFIKTKAKGYYYNGLELASTDGHVGFFGGQYSGGSAVLQARVGGSGINSSDNIALNINSNGHVFKPSQPLAVVRYTANTEHGAYNAGSNRNIIICKPQNVQINQGSHYNASTGQFTCPVNGTYRVAFMGNFLNSDVSNYILIQIRKNGSSVDQYYQDDIGTWNHVIRVAYVTCSANDTLEVYNNCDSAGASKGGFDIVQYTGFNYSLVG